MAAQQGVLVCSWSVFSCPGTEINLWRGPSAASACKHGITTYPDNLLFAGIKAFQSDYGLKQDGVMKPGGETENTLGMTLIAMERPDKPVAPATTHKPKLPNAKSQQEQPQSTPPIAGLRGGEKPQHSQPSDRLQPSMLRTFSETINNVAKGVLGPAHPQALALARGLMKDREKAAEINRKKPNKTLGQLIQKNIADGRTGEAIYEAIRESAFRTNKQINDKLLRNKENPIIKEYRVHTEENNDGFPCIRVAARDGVGQKWVDGLCEHLSEKFGYKITDKIDGPTGEIIRDLANGTKKVYVVNDDFDGAEIHPEDKEAEEDILKIAAYLKDILESQNAGPEET